MRFNLRRLPVVKRLIPSVRRRLRALVNAEPYGVYRYRGVAMLLNPDNFTDRQIVYFKDFEHRQIDTFVERLAAQGCDLFLDIGAHKGLYSLIVDRRRLAGRIVAFEPDMRNWRNLQANLLLNDADARIEVCAKAVGAENRTVAFHLAAADKTGRSRVMDTDAGTTDGATTVDAVALDTLFHDRGKRLGVKIDVEGYEIEVLRGMRSLLTDNRCVLQIEADSRVADDLIAYMADLGFRHRGQIDIDHYFDNAR